MYENSTSVNISFYGKNDSVFITLDKRDLGVTFIHGLEQLHSDVEAFRFLIREFACDSSAAGETNITSVLKFHYLTHQNYSFSTDSVKKCLIYLPPFDVTIFSMWTGSMLYILADDARSPWDMWLRVQSNERFIVTGSVQFVPSINPHIGTFSYDKSKTMQFRKRFDVAPNQNLMLSFVLSTVCKQEFMIGGIELLEINILQFKKRWIPIQTYRYDSSFINLTATLFTSNVMVTCTFRHLFSYDVSMFKNGIQVRSSYHLVNESISQLSPGLFNCSQHYAAFRHHLGCNLRPECLGGEDETEACPYTNHRCPQPSLYVQGKCITLHKMPSAVNFMEARKLCQANGGDLAMLKTPQERTMMRHLWDKGISCDLFMIGRRNRRENKAMYRKVWHWVDGTPDLYKSNVQLNESWTYDYSLMVNRKSSYNNNCAFISFYLSLYIFSSSCNEKITSSFLCEQAQSSNETKSPVTVQFPVLRKSSSFTLRNSASLYTDCDAGRFFTHQFLSCDRRTRCKVKGHPAYCPYDVTDVDSSVTALEKQLLVAMFRCHMTLETVHYTLVCDFRQDCSDGSDEAHCQHKEPFSGFRCHNGQWINIDQFCDQKEDCVDYSDEICETLDFDETRMPGPPVLINANGRGSFIGETMNSSSAGCPETHFPCHGEHLYCMPVYLRCNGVKDCLGGEDEITCDDVTCPGYYRCMSSSVCLHGNHVCDGWPQCPERDDELLCNASCPSACHCQGLAFVCHQSFPVSRYPDLKYLDATRSAMIPAAVAENFYLLYLSFAACGLYMWPELQLPNLQTLDLSRNQLTTFNLQFLYALPNLRDLILSQNPLISLLQATEKRSHKLLVYMTLDHTLIKEMNITSFDILIAIKQLNLSYSSLTKFHNSGKGLSSLTRLSTFDVRGCNIEEFPDNLFQGLQNLQYVYAKNYKFCCKANLPLGFNLNSCVSEKDDISSCSNLVGSNICVFFLWIIAALSFIGNAVCLTFKIFYKHIVSKSGYTNFVSNLNFSDLLMGLYLIFIGVANEIYRGRYLWREQEWKTSLTCTTAGFICFVCYEVSAFMICLITVDRFIVLRFPFSTVRFTGKSAVTTSAMAWAFGASLAAVPLFSGQSHWKFYSQTATCIPLPVTRQFYADKEGQSYAFGVMIVFNCVLFITIAVGQFFIYQSIKLNAMTTLKTKTVSKNSTIAIRLITVAVSDFLCFFPIGALGLAVSNGVSIPGEVSVVVAIFILPINAALSPFLYTYNMMMEKRHRKEQNKLIKELQDHFAT